MSRFEGVGDGVPTPLALAVGRTLLEQSAFQVMPNVGQVADPAIRLYSRAPGGFLTFQDDGWSFIAMAREADTEAVDPDPNRTFADRSGVSLAPTRAAIVRVAPIEAPWFDTPIVEQPLAGIVNYYLGNDPSQWRERVPTFGSVRYQGVYRGIDLVFRGDGRFIKNEWLVQPESDPTRIRLTISGDVSRLWVDWSGALRIETPIGELIEQAPEVYQCRSGGLSCEPSERERVAARYVIDEGWIVHFGLDVYDPSRGLIIDPTIGYSSYLGGSASDSGAGIAVDAAGNVYVAGNTGGSFPTLTPFQGAFGTGSADAFVAKVNANGTLGYSSYLGGNVSDQALAIAVDAAGNAYVTGTTTSPNFPTLNAFQTSFGGINDAFVTKVNANGTLGYSSYLGGSNLDVGQGIAVDIAGNVYVTGATQGGFPLVNAFQGVFGGFVDAFVTKVNANATVAYSSYLGGGGQDVGAGIAVDVGGNVYLTGVAEIGFPTVSPFQGTFGGGVTDAFVTKLNASGSTIVYSSFLGGSTSDSGNGIAVDATGNVYLIGTTSGSFPTVNPFQGTFGGGASDAFIAKVNPNGTAVAYSSYLGGGGVDMGAGIGIDSGGNAYVVGRAGAGFPTVNAFQGAFGGGSNDVFIAKVNPNGSAVAFSSYLGGSGGDIGHAIAVDPTGNAYITGQTTGSFPTANALQGAFGGGGADAVLVKITTESNGPLFGGLDTLIPISPPIRVLDTRNPPTGFDAATGNPIAAAAFHTNQTRGYRLANKTFGAFTFPTTFRAVLATVSLVDTAPAGGFVTVAGVNPPPPGVATALPQGTAAAPFISSTFAFTQVDAGGNFYVFNVGATRQIIVDIVGYYQLSIDRQATIATTIISPTTVRSAAPTQRATPRPTQGPASRSGCCRCTLTSSLGSAPGRRRPTAPLPGKLRRGALRRFNHQCRIKTGVEPFDRRFAIQESLFRLPPGSDGVRIDIRPRKRG